MTPSRKKTAVTPPPDAMPSPRQRILPSRTEHDYFTVKLLRLAEQQLRSPALPYKPNADHVAILKKGAAAWNEWRQIFPRETPNLAHLDIRAHNFADLRGVNLIGANLYKTYANVDLSGADLRCAFLRQANLPAKLRGAKLTGASLYMARLKRADLTGATLLGADLRGALLHGTRLTNADISGAQIYGIAAWDVKTDGLTQNNLVITPWDQPEITVDSIEMGVPFTSIRIFMVFA
jgi:Pentapeptide repeats (8 copies)